MPEYDEIKPCIADPIAIAPWVSSHIFENELLVFSERSQTVFTLNTTAAFIWFCCEKQMNLADIARELSKTFNVNIPRAESDIKTVINQWMSLELIDKGLRKEIIPLAVHAMEPSENSPLVGQRYSSELNIYNSFHLRLAGFDFLLRFSHKMIEQLVIPVFAHLGCAFTDKTIIFDIIKSDNKFLIASDGLIVDMFTEEAEIVPRLSYYVIDSTYRKIDFLIAIHAAALSLGNGCVVLPGNCGVGKTTLAAALIKAGFKYFTDDTAILNRKTGSIIAVPVSLRIKEGSWGTIEKMFQKSFAATVHTSSDGRKIRYLVPPEGSFDKANVASDFVKVVVFPKYSPESKTSIQPISRLDAIRRIQECGYDVGACLNKAKVIELLDWIKDIDCYEMNISSLSEATSILRSLLN